MIQRLFSVGSLLALFFVATTHAQLVTLVEDFEDPQLPFGGWRFNASFNEEEIREGEGGNHYSYAYVDDYGIILSTDVYQDHPWVGDIDYRESGVVELAFTTAAYAQRGVKTLPMSVLIHNNNGTPLDIDDDYGFYMVLHSVLRFDGQQIKTFTFPIPSQVQGETPEGWHPYIWGPGSPVEFTWDEVITDVDRIMFDYFHPAYYYIYEPYNVGADNIKITIDLDIYGIGSQDNKENLIEIDDSEIEADEP